MSERLAKPSNTSRVWEVASASGIACGRRQTTRTPLGASSPARMRENASIAALATPLPRKPRPVMREPGVDSVRMTPEPCSVMCRATAFAVRKFVRV